MNRNQLVTIEKAFEKYANDPEFRATQRRFRPYQDLIVQVITRRSELGMTQKELAEKASTFQSRISKIESGDHDLRLSTLIELAEALGCEVCINLVPMDHDPDRSGAGPCAQPVRLEEKNFA